MRNTFKYITSLFTVSNFQCRGVLKIQPIFGRPILINDPDRSNRNTLFNKLSTTCGQIHTEQHIQFN